MTLAKRITQTEKKNNRKNSKGKDTSKVSWLQGAMESKRYTGIKVYSDRNK